MTIQEFIDKWLRGRISRPDCELAAADLATLTKVGLETPKPTPTPTRRTRSGRTT